MDKHYDHKTTEDKIFNMWQDMDAFSPEGATKLRRDAELEVKEASYTVLMPPPNANAPLHCGHGLYTIQDLMTRYKRMQGFQTLYVPGTDHAGFETQVVYERNLKKVGKTRFDFDRSTLFKDILDFVKQNSDIAVNQLKKLGMSADWARNTFTLDDDVVATVYQTFLKMHKDGLIYRGTYLVNYSPYHGTTFSNLETDHKETISPLYYVKYQLKGSAEYLVVATVRPETIFGDVAIAVNPKDSRYKDFVGNTVINPLTNVEIPVISDPYVDVEFGTGALKITPGHDFNDYEIGLRHKLPKLSVIDLSGKMTVEAGELAGLSVKEARVRTIAILKEKDALEKVDEQYKHNLLVDYKDKLPIEPMLLPNWFIKMEPLAKKAIAAIEHDDVKFYLPKWKKEVLRWLNNIRDWPISRQIVFSIQMPIWYPIELNPELFIVFIDGSGVSHEGKIQDLLHDYTIKDIRLGLQKIISPIDAKYEVAIESPGDNYLQETDTFDTWFSSGQWPLVTLGYPDNSDSKKFFPTTFLDTMWDIIFFWVARMIMFSLYLTDKVPFKQVYIHGAITDEQGRKMSKSLGNVINPMEFVEKYGSDALRMGLLVGGNTAAKTTSLSEAKVKGYRNFANKLWNMARFITLMTSQYEQNTGERVLFYTKDLESELDAKDKLILEQLAVLVKNVTKNLDKYRIADAGEDIYQFIWHVIADDYIEYVKTKEAKKISLSVLLHVFKTSLKLLHPFMPFITEELWNCVPQESKLPLIVTNWPK